MGFNTDPNAALPVWIAARPGGGGGEGIAEGISLSGSVDAASEAIVPAGTFSTWFTVQNTHATLTLYLSFNDEATVQDIKILAGAAITLPFAPTNPLNAMGSGPGTTFAVVGY